MLMPLAFSGTAAPMQPGAEGALQVAFPFLDGGREPRSVRVATEEP